MLNLCGTSLKNVVGGWCNCYCGSGRYAGRYATINECIGACWATGDWDPVCK